MGIMLLSYFLFLIYSAIFITCFGLFLAEKEQKNGGVKNG